MGRLHRILQTQWIKSSWKHLQTSFLWAKWIMQLVDLEIFINTHTPWRMRQSEGWSPPENLRCHTCSLPGNWQPGWGYTWSWVTFQLWWVKSGGVWGEEYWKEYISPHKSKFKVRMQNLNLKPKKLSSEHCQKDPESVEMDAGNIPRGQEWRRGEGHKARLEARDGAGRPRASSWSLRARLACLHNGGPPSLNE